MCDSAKKWVLMAILLMVTPLAIVCELPGLEGLFHVFDYEFYYDDYYYDDYHQDCWFDCDDEWFFDFEWWW